MSVIPFQSRMSDVTDTEVISGILKALEITMVINKWTHDAVIYKGNRIVLDADSLYIDVISMAQNMRFNSKFLNKSFISDLIKRDAVYEDTVLEFFENNKWDGTPRFKEVRRVLKLSKGDSQKFRLWFRQGAAIVYNTGEATDIQRNFMLILYSRTQGNGKSTLARKLSLDTNSFGDSSIDLQYKESVRRTYESWIYEYPELSSMFRKADVNALKTFITSNSQNFRLAYDKFFTRYPTRTSIIGTTNDEEIFIDDTGSRRFLVIHANWDRSAWKDINKIDWAQVWLQARHEYLEGKPIVMNFAEQQSNEAENDKFSYTSAACYKLMAFVEDKEYVSTGICEFKLTDIINHLAAQRIDAHTKMIFSTMNRLGYTTIKTKTSCTFTKDLKDKT